MHPKRLTLNPRPFLLSSGQKGQSTAYIILFILVIIFAVMFAGGGSFLFSGNEASVVPEDTPTPSPDPAAPTATPSSSLAWSVDYAVGDCVNPSDPQKIGNVMARGPVNGYILIKIESTGGTFEQIGVTRSFTSPEGQYPIFLENSKGFNTKNWRIELYSGGDASLTGGKLEKTKEGDPTGC